jgi:hypothetical protein
MAPAHTAAVRRIRVSAALWSGLIAGFVFLAFEMAILMMMGQSPWGPPRMMGAIVLGRDVLPPPATFDMGAVAAAMLVHFPLSILYASVLALALERLSLWPALLAGAAFGLAIYFINFYGFTALFPWFADARGAGSLGGHVAFGLVLAFAYKKLAR